MTERALAADSARALVIGLGNPILGDDGIGWHVADQVRGRLGDDPRVEVISLAAGGLTLMEHLVGRERAVLVDAMVTGRSTVGTVRCCGLAELPEPEAGHSGSVHDASLRTAIEAGRLLGAALPRDITVVAVEVAPESFEFREELTPAAAAAVPEAVRRVLEALSPPTEG